MHRSNKMTLASNSWGFLPFWEIPTWVQVSLCPRLYVRTWVGLSTPLDFKTCGSGCLKLLPLLLIFSTISPLLNVCIYLARGNSEYLGKRNIQFSKGQNQIFLDFWKPPVLATVLQGLLINTIINLYSIKCRWYFDLSLPNFLAKRFSFDVAFIIVLKTKVQFHFSRIHGKILELIFDVMSSF